LNVAGLIRGPWNGRWPIYLQRHRDCVLSSEDPPSPCREQSHLDVDDLVAQADRQGVVLKRFHARTAIARQS
jgi:hypothetical protein